MNDGNAPTRLVTNAGGTRPQADSKHLTRYSYCKFGRNLPEPSPSESFNLAQRLVCDNADRGTQVKRAHRTEEWNRIAGRRVGL